MTPRLAYSLAEAAQALSLGVRSLRYLLRTGKLGYARLGRRVLIPHTELEKLLQRVSVKATVPLDADEPICPMARTGNGHAPRGKREASVTSASERAQVNHLEAYRRPTRHGYPPPVTDPWEGMQTLPTRPYTAYRGLRYGKVVRHG
jgi:excisionase family DNA binding protein